MFVGGGGGVSVCVGGRPERRGLCGGDGRVSMDVGVGVKG